MKTFTFDSLDTAYYHLVKEVYENGDEVSPRGALTKEISPVTITITDPRKRVISHPIRKLNYGFMIGESMWYLNGTDELDMVSHYNSQWKRFSDDGKTLNGAYGKRIFNYEELNGETINQIEQVISKLKVDKDSRHGTVLIFRPSDLVKNTKDVPCNNLLRFSIRNNKLRLMNFVRSNDIIFGLPYDAHFFMLLQEIVASRLGVELGEYVHIVDSFHLYEMHFEMAQKIIEYGPTNIYDKIEVQDYGFKDDKEYKETLSIILELEKVSRTTPEQVEVIKELISKISNKGWKNYAKVLASYNFKKAEKYDESNSLLDELIGEFKELCSWRK